MSDPSAGSHYGFPHFTLNALRIVAGFLFMQHGAQKLFGVLGGNVAEAWSLFYWAGIFEFFGGILIILGILTRPVALLLAAEMAIAYFRAHLPRGFWPIMNGGELAALYGWLFLFLAAHGGGRFSVDGLLAARRRAQIAE